MPLIVVLLALHERLVRADVRRRRDTRDARQLVALGGPERQVLLAVDDVVGVDLVGDRRLRRGVEARAEHRHDRHEREPDHERGGGRRGPAGIADGVGAGQLAGDAAGAARRPADHAGQRLDEPRREQRDAGEQPEHAAAEQQRDRDRRSTPPAKMPTEIAAIERPATPRPALSECAASRDGRQRRALADGRDRRHARRPPRGQDARDQRDRRCRAPARR